MWYVDNTFDFPDWDKVIKLPALSHGIDTDHLFDRKYIDHPLSESYMNFISLLFSRYDFYNYEPIDLVKNFYKIDPNEKSVLYLGTIGQC